MDTATTPICKINESHCEACGSTDRQDVTGNGGYSKCCNELVVWSSEDCRAHHVR